MAMFLPPIGTPQKRSRRTRINLAVNKIYLITGGTGTFGKAATRQLLRDQSIGKIVILSRDEQKQQEMAWAFQDERMRFMLGDVRDEARLVRAFKDIDYVIHAAALKIVPKGEYDGREFVETNVNGTQRVISAALSSGVQRVLLISTDKAVAPCNLYGATKLLAEKLFISANHLAAMREPYFSVIRYGNVTGSRGSVLDMWASQILEEKPLTVTDGNATRFWITQAEAAVFAIHAIEMKMRYNGGEIFVPRMPAYRVADLAEALTKVQGTEDPIIAKTGLRPGEKLHEDILSPHEKVFEHKDFFRISALDKTSCQGGKPLGLAGQSCSSSFPPMTVKQLTELLRDWKEGKL